MPESDELDVFVSYSHIDNEPETEGEPGWVERFGRQLEVRLRKLTGRKDVSVWRDDQLRRAQLFDKEITSAVRRARVMISLISNGYLNSEYCAQEIEWFLAKAREEPAGVEVGNTLRVFPVLLQNLPPDRWPPGVRGTSGFPLHTVRDTRLERDRERIGEPLDTETADFENAVQGIAEEICRVLRDLASGPSAASDASDDPDAFKVFLSHPSDDMGAQQRRLARELESAGVEVVKGVPPPHDEAAHAECVEQAVKGAHLSIHLLGRSAGEALDDEDDPAKTYPLVQARIGLEHAQSQLILQPEALDFDLLPDAAYREFLEELDGRERDPARLEIVRTDKNRMLDVVLEKRKALLEARRVESATAEGRTAFVDLNLHDLGAAAEMVDYLTKRNVAPLLAPSADPQPAMEQFAKNLKLAELYILYFGKVTRSWVENRLRAAQQLIWENDLEKRIGIYVAPPHKSSKEINFAPYPVAVNLGGFDPSTLDALLG